VRECDNGRRKEEEKKIGENVGAKSVNMQM
jgi:hypothetical protein